MSFDCMYVHTYILMYVHTYILMYVHTYACISIISLPHMAWRLRFRSVIVVMQAGRGEHSAPFDSHSWNREKVNIFHNRFHSITYSTDSPRYAKHNTILASLAQLYVTIYSGENVI